MGVVCTVFIALFFFFLFIIVRDTHRFVISDYTVVSGKLTKDMTICVLADLHGKDYGNGNEALIAAVRDAGPDLVLGAGDIVSAARQPYEKMVRGALPLISELVKICPVFLANGNHEYKMFLEPERFGPLYERYEKDVTGKGARVLRNDTAAADDNVSVTGLETPYDFYRKFAPYDMQGDHLENLLGRPDRERFNILIAHNPTYMDRYAAWGADLIVSGHYHGGIMRIPVLGGVISPMLTFFPKYHGGRYDESGSTMIVSRGLGTHTLHVRVFNPGELVIIRLKKA